MWHQQPCSFVLSVFWFLPFSKLLRVSQSKPPYFLESQRNELRAKRGASVARFLLKKQTFCYGLMQSQQVFKANVTLIFELKRWNLIHRHTYFFILQKKMMQKNVPRKIGERRLFLENCSLPNKLPENWQIYFFIDGKIVGKVVVYTNSALYKSWFFMPTLQMDTHGIVVRTSDLQYQGSRVQSPVWAANSFSIFFNIWALSLNLSSKWKTSSEWLTSSSCFYN